MGTFVILLALFFIGFLSAFLQSGIGFGAAVVMVNIIPLFINPGKAIVISQFTCIFFALYIVLRSYKNIRFDVMLPVLLPSLVCTIVATKLTVGIDVSTMKLLLGILFVVLSVYFSFIAGRLSIKPTKTSGIIIGSISGAMNGMFGTGGPPAVLYMTPALPEKSEYIATSQSFFMTTNIVSLLTRVIEGTVVVSDLRYMSVSAVGALCGAMVGLKVTKNLNGILLKRFIYVFIGINGVIIIINQLI